MRRSPEIEAVVRRLFAARDRLDTDTVQNFHAASPEFLVVGTAEEEWLDNADYSFRFWKAFAESAKVARSELTRLDGFENGDTGWAVGAQRWIAEDGSEHTMRFTLVLFVQSGAWKVIHAHYSYPVANADVHGSELTETLRGLLDAIEADADHPSPTRPGTATVMFTDLAGSTEMAGTMSDAEFGALIGEHLASLGLTAERHGGRMVKTLGDGAMFMFGSAASALESAIAMQRSAASSGLGLRVGVHTGDVVSEAGDYLGLTVNKAARITDLAGSGQILASSTTAAMVNPVEFQFEPEIIAELEGLSGTHEVVPVRWRD